jgi:signal transduction histidine kinase
MIKRMTNEKVSKSNKNDNLDRTAENFRYLSHQILDFANRGYSKFEFIGEISKVILEFSGCDSLELWLKEENKYIYLEIGRGQDFPVKYKVIYEKDLTNIKCYPSDADNSIINQLRIDVIQQKRENYKAHFTDYGSFWSGDIATDLKFFKGSKDVANGPKSDNRLNYNSLSIIPLILGNDFLGLIQLFSCKLDFFREYDIKHYEITAETLGIALANERTQVALRERVKELTCLYNIAQVIERKEYSLDEILIGIVNLLPPAWQYPEVTAGKIVFDKQVYSTPGFQTDQQRLSSRIKVKGKMRGKVEVVYTEEKPEMDEGPFLREERSLINAIAKQIAIFIERMENEVEKAKLEEQLRHSDRLATLGQLAAGVAHEINEPLGSILGFAQLAKKTSHLPKEVIGDLTKIEMASLHAREVVKKLMLFGRQIPPLKTRININKIVEEGLYFIKSRCIKAGIEIELSLKEKLPKITADQSQIYQVLVNLVVNAIQSMPDGGKLTIKTTRSESDISLIVKDNGIGMNNETRKKIFLPFFTTKEINEGTGIGLSVVHGIVKSHGGSIIVESVVNKGSQFEIKFPISDNNPKENE